MFGIEIDDYMYISVYLKPSGNLLYTKTFK